MKIVKYAKYVGTVIGPGGRVQRSTAPRKNFIERTKKNNALHQESGGEIVRCQIYALSLLGHIGSISARDEATLNDEAHALQCTADSHQLTTRWLCVRP